MLLSRFSLDINKSHSGAVALEVVIVNGIFYLLHK